MKSLFTILTLIGSLSFASDKVIEVGTYKAVDVDSSTITATLVLREGNTINILIAAPDFEMPKDGCAGTYTVKENLMSAYVVCKIEDFEKMDVTIDITSVNPESVRSAAGAVVDVVILALGAEPTKFTLIKIK